MKKEKDIKINKKDLDKLLSEIDREYDLAMAEIKRLHQKKIELVKEVIAKKDRERLKRLRKKILNK
jgi:hypothetical protein